MSENTTENMITTITALAQDVATATDEHDKAHEAEVAAKVALWARIVDTIRPALRAICTRPKVYSNRGNNPLRGEDVERHAGWSGLYLGAERVGPVHRGGRDDTQGRYSGFDVFLRADGALVGLSYSGTWSRWENSCCEWEAEEKAVEPECVDLDEALPALVRALEAQAEARPKAAMKARDRAARLAALAALLK